MNQGDGSIYLCARLPIRRLGLGLLVLMSPLGAAANPAGAAELSPNARSVGEFARQLQGYASKPPERRFELPSGASLDAAVANLKAEGVRSRLAPPARSSVVPRRSVRARAASATRYQDLGPGAASALTQRLFRPLIADASATPDLRDVVGFRGPRVAVLRRKPGHKQELLLSPVPLGAGAAGSLKPIDLSLERDGEGWSPVNSSVQTQFPPTAADEFQAAAGITFELVGGHASPGRKNDDSAVFYPDVRADTDVSISPTTSGAETFFTLRSEDSPESTTMRITGGGTTLAKSGRGVRILRAGKVVGAVRPPVAVDADGTSVPVEMTVQGDGILITAQHRGRGYAYPILVDPTIDTTDGIPGSTGAIRQLADYLNPEGELGSMDPSDRGRWYAAGLEEEGLTAEVDGAAGDGLYLARQANTATSPGFWVFVLPNSMRVTQVDFGPHAEDHGTDDPADDPVGMALLTTGDGESAIDTTDGVGKYTVVEHTSSGDVQGLVFGLVGGESEDGFDDDHTAFLGNAVIHVVADGAPTLVTSSPGDQNPGLISWTNWNVVLPMSLEAESTGTGVKRLEIAARDAEGNEQVLGEYEDACDGSLEAPCPSTLQHDIDMDFSLLDEGSYTLRLRAYDPFGAVSEDAYAHFGIDRTPPEQPDIDASLVGSNASPAVRVEPTVSDPGSSEVSSGISGVKVTDDDDTGAAYDVTTSCVTDDCDDPINVPLHDDEELDHHITVKAQDLAGNVSMAETTVRAMAWTEADGEGEGD